MGEWEKFKPMEPLVFDVGQTRTFRVSEYRFGEQEITRKDGTTAVIPVLVVRLSELDGKPIDREYFLSPKNLVWDLRGILARPDFRDLVITVTASMEEAPRKRFTVGVMKAAK